VPHCVEVPMRPVALSIVLLLAAGGCAADGTDEPSAIIVVTALAGPTCPVETDPPSPECAPRPVVDAVIVVVDPGGSEVARAATGADGTVSIAVPAGTLIVTPQPVEGLPGTAPPSTVTVPPGSSISVAADYDTGIR